jgi:alpha-D-ribose 1-methylphosphonate 5-triphosphate diphosphatase
MTASEITFTNARIMLPEEVVTGSVRIANGTIAAIDASRSSLPSAIDCGGDLLIPGLVELHTDNVERHIQPRPGAVWPTSSAILNHDRETAACGITTVLNALCVGEVHSRSIRLGHLHEMRDALDAHTAQGTLKIQHYIHWRCEVSFPRLKELLEPLMGHPRLRLVSVMDHTPGQRQFVDISKYAEYYQGKFGMSDAELAEFMETRRRDQKTFSGPNRAYVVASAKQHGVPIASHDDATTEHVNEAIDDGITVAEFPTTLEAAAASHGAGMQVLMGGPNIVRGKSHSGNASALDLAAAGYLDIVSSDYVPASLLWGALKLHTEAGIALPAAIATVTRNPAKAVGFTDRGEIAIGQRADLARVTPTDGPPVVREVWCAGARVT